MIDIFFDATPLALWAKSVRHRAGVGRVAVNLLRVFLQQKDCRVIFVCPKGMEWDVHLFIECVPWAGSVIFPYTPEQPKMRVKDFIKELVQKVLHRMPGRLHGMIKRLLRPHPYAMYDGPMPELKTILEKYSADPSRRYIYFSSFEPLPEIVCTFPQIEKFVYLHDIIPLRLPDKHGGTHACGELMRLHLERADVIWCNSQFTRKDFLDYFPNADPSRLKVALLGGGKSFSPATPPDVTRALMACGVPPTSRYILSLSTLEPRKGMLRLIRAFASLQEKGQLADMHLVLVGQKGWQYDAIVRAAYRLGGHVHLTGFLPDSDLGALMTGCTCFAYLSEYEGFGLPVVEAMACGSPMVVTEATSLPEVAGDAGILVPAMDDAALESALVRICSDGALREQLRAKGLARSGQFTWKRCGETILSRNENI